MKLLIMDMQDDEGTGLNLGLRAQDAGHEVRYWLSRKHPAGDGILDKPRDWKPSADWAELIVLTGNCDYPDGLIEAFGRGLPIFGANPKAAELELDRGKGQEVMKEAGIETLPYTVVDSADEGIQHIVDTGLAFAMKPWGGTADKAMTAIPKTPEEAIFTLQNWKRQGLFKGQLMLQEKVDGVEIGVSAFFGPGGWSRAIEESFEHKKFLTGDLGGNTGEMGTVIRHAERAKLFDLLLEPLGDYLHACNYVGDCSINCIVDASGTPWPLEFTMRLGWPDFNIRQELVQNDPIEWMADLLFGRDSLAISQAIAVGVVMIHGDFPREDDPPEVWAGYPISGIDEDTYPHLHFQQVMDGNAPRLKGGKLGHFKTMLTAGTYPLVVTGSGRTVIKARDAAYETVKKISWPSNVGYRLDIGERLEKQLSLIQKHGFAKGMEYGRTS